MQFILQAIFREMVRISSRQHALHYEMIRLRQEVRHAMDTEAEALNELAAKVDDLIADVRAALAAVVNDPDNKLGPDGQAAFDALAATIDAFDAEITPVVPEPVPVPEPEPTP